MPRISSRACRRSSMASRERRPCFQFARPGQVGDQVIDGESLERRRGPPQTALDFLERVARHSPSGQFPARSGNPLSASAARRRSRS